MIYSTVEGLRFTRFRVFGEYIPSVKSIEDVMRDRPNEAARVDFQTLSNHICEIYEQECKNEYPSDIPANKQARDKIDLLREEWGRTEAICKQIKYDFYQLMISRYIIFWYHAVAGNFSGGNPQTIIKGNKPPKGYMEPILKLRKYPDFVLTEDCLNKFIESVNSTMSDSNDNVFKLPLEIEKIHRDLAKIEGISRQKGSAVHSFYCDYCQSYHTFSDLKVRTTCGSSECEKKLDANRQREKRGEDSGIFVAGYDGKPRRCRECKKKRIVTTEKVCKDCLMDAV